MLQPRKEPIKAQVSLSVSNAIQNLNAAAYNALIACADSNDPLAPMLLGVSPEVLAEMKGISKADFMSASRSSSITLVILRFPDAATWRYFKAEGFNKAIVLREYLKQPGITEEGL